MKTSYARESLFQPALLKELNKIPGSWWVKISQRSLNGTPDILGHVAGYFVAIEVKKDKSEKPTKLQQVTLNRIAKRGAFSFLVAPENAQSILDFLDSLAKTHVSLGHTSGFNIDCLKQVECCGDAASSNFNYSDWKVIPLR